VTYGKSYAMRLNKGENAIGARIAAGVYAIKSISVNGRTTENLNRRVIELMKNSGKAFKTITADNGTEFDQYEVIEEVTGVTFYFATPHHSRERETNNNTNGLIRQ